LNSLNSGARLRQCGFSLLEILVAFAILAIFLGVLLNIFSGGVRGADTTGQYARAVQVAESLLAGVGHDVALEAKVMDGESDEVYRWRIAIEPYTPPEADWQPEKTPLQAYRIGVAVFWTSGSSERQFALTSLRLAPASTDPQAGRR
jgi:general secretion pathway protein I